MKIENIDKFGHCVLCHRNLVKNTVIGGKVQGVFDADKDEAYMKLNNGSLMPICLCTPCKNSMDLSDPINHTQIMETVQNGWTLEIAYMKEHPEKFPDFTPDKEKKLKELYNGLSIVSHEINHKVGV